MSQPNNFRHQRYTTDRPAAPFQLLTAEGPCEVESEEFAATMRQVGNCLKAANVRNIVLTHGTFAGGDPLGVIQTLGHVLGQFNAKVKELAKRVIDALASDAGNFTKRYRDTLEHALNAGDPNSGEPIRVHRFLWSSENNHIGRADGAVQLIEFLKNTAATSGGRTLLVGHSHGGNVLALATNLLHADLGALDTFFAAAKSYYTIPGTKIVDARPWTRVRKLLMDDGAESRAAKARLRALPLDLVTLGTPIRYGWDLGGEKRLLHIINHKPTPLHPEHLACLPENVNDLVNADVGDLIQLLGIAGTNLIPNLLSPRAILADRKLKSVLQDGLPRSSFLSNFRCGMRVADQGSTLLINFGPKDNNVIRSLTGHAIYTRLPQMAYLFRMIAAALYGESAR